MYDMRPEVLEAEEKAEEKANAVEVAIAQPES